MRLITRANFDGVMCAVFLTQMEQIEQVVFTHPEAIEDGSVRAKAGDAIANLPFHHNASLWFDHHMTTDIPTDAMLSVKGKRGIGASASRMVYEYYNTPRLSKFEGLLKECDIIASANLSVHDVLTPEKWVLLSYTLDPYMGLAAFTGYANEIISAIKNGLTIGQILDMSEVKGRVNRYLMDAEDFKQEIQNVTRLDGNVIITDSREVDLMPTGNRFMAFALFGEGNVQLALTRHSQKSKIRVRMGKSIFNKSCKLNLGRIAAEYGGGGLEGAAGCLFDYEGAEAKIAELVEKLKAPA